MTDGSRWRVVVAPRAEKELKQLPAQGQARVRRAIDALAEGAENVDLRKLQGKDDEWRLRVGDWRVRLKRDEAARTLVILRVLPRGRAYRD